MTKDKKQTNESKAAQQPEKTRLVKMVHERKDGSTGPTKADVHPAEVDNFKTAGWQVKE